MINSTLIYPLTNKLDSHPSALTKQIVFIDSNVQDYEFLAKGVLSSIETVILDRDRDGIQQITDVLSQKENVAEVHIVSHGSPGCLYLGNTQLSIDTLNKYQSDLRTWSEQLTIINCQLSILIYGCNVAAGDAGEEFIAKLHSITGAEIAASTTPIGNAAKGGNWELDLATNQINTSIPFEEIVQQSYSGVFANTTYDNTTSGGFGSSPSKISRTFNVTEDGTLNGLTVGLNAAHTYRGDIKATLTAPDGASSVVLIPGGGDGDDNYDILLETGGGALDNNSSDNTASPLYDRSVAPSGSFDDFVNSFAGKSIQGSWTLTIEDTFTGSDNGTFNSAQLNLDYTPSQNDSISGQIFNDDTENDDAFGSGDTPLAGVTVELFSDPDGNGNSADGASLGTTVTDSNGLYQFTNLADGNYVVQYTEPNGFTAVTDTDGGDTKSIGVTLPNPSSTGQASIVDITQGATLNSTNTVTGSDGLQIDFDIFEVGSAEFQSTAATDASSGSIGIPYGFLIQSSDLSDGNAFTNGSETVSGQTPDDVNVQNYTIYRLSLSEPTDLLNFTLSDFDTDYEDIFNGSNSTTAEGDGYFDAGAVIIRDSLGNFSSPVPSNLGSELEGYNADLINSSIVDGGTDANFAGINASSANPFALNAIRHPGHSLADNSPGSQYTTINGLGIIQSPDDADGFATFDSLEDVTEVYAIYWNEWLGEDNRDNATPDDGQGISIFNDLNYSQRDSIGNNFLIESAPASTYSLSGTVYNDTNLPDDNLIETDDTPLGGVEVKLFANDGDGNPDGTAIAITTTNVNTGLYEFTGLAPGDYVVMETQPEGFTSVTDADGNEQDKILTSIVNSNVENQDFLEEPTVYSLSGTVYNDTNLPDDNLIETDDTPLGEVEVKLFANDGDGNPDGTVIATTTTNVNTGLYEFTGLAPGDYVVMETQPEGFTSVTDADGNEQDKILATIVNQDIIDRDFLEEIPIAPTIDLDGDNDLTGNDFATSFLVGGDSVSISDDVLLGDLDSANLQNAVIKLTIRADGDTAESLEVNGTLPDGITAEAYNPTTGILTLTGDAPIADYQMAIEQIEYNNTIGYHSSDRLVEVTVNDGLLDSNTAISTISFDFAPAIDLDSDNSALG